MILIYTQNTTNRLKYIFEVIFKCILGCEYSFTSDQEAFINYEGPKFSYGKRVIGSELFIQSSHLLFEKGIIEQEIKVFDWQDTKAFFGTSVKSSLPFDPFAAAFYLVSRYEEYLPHIQDAYERFVAKESVAYKNGFLDKPIVNIWANKIKSILLNKFPDTQFPSPKYEFISTIDIDNAYAYKEKGFMRTSGAYARSLFKFNFNDIKDRTSVLLGIQRDPYDTYEYQLSLKKRYGFRSIYFFLVGEYGENDKNISIGSRKFQALIKSISDYAEIGIHPSYGSNKEPQRIKKELNKLGKIIKRDIVKSRQHFLKLLLPTTYRRLIDLDIKEDYTMGYAAEAGFRASICTPYYFYDLDMEVATNLILYPFAVMDSTLKYYLKLNPEETISIITSLIDEVKNVNGTFISLWHNESLGENHDWRGWQAVYEKMIRYAIA